MHIELKLGELTWSHCRINCDGRVIEIEFGDCSDAVGDLLRTALLIATGAPSATCSFDGEPYEWRLTLDWTLEWPNRLDVQIRGFPDIYARAPNEEGELLYSIVCRPDDFARAVARAGQALLDELGIEGFDARWRPNRFPIRALRSLQAALSLEELPPLPPSRDDQVTLFIFRPSEDSVDQ